MLNVCFIIIVDELYGMKCDNQYLFDLKVIL